jgi:hypothetical protein
VLLFRRQRGDHVSGETMKLSACLSAALLLFSSVSCLALDRSFDTRTGRLKAERVAGGLEHPWGIAFLPNRGPAGSV